jgi:hypothetical protein
MYNVSLVVVPRHQLIDYSKFKQKNRLEGGGAVANNFFFFIHFFFLEFGPVCLQWNWS